EGNTDYLPQRLEFLWVRWFSPVAQALSTGWQARHLDRIGFPPLSNHDSFGFLDPSNVVRACHIIPHFFGGKASQDVRGLSRLAQDIRDWESYYINRFVDRDMVMRYLWGLSVGHVYTHPQVPPQCREERSMEHETMINQPPVHDDSERSVPTIRLADMLASLDTIAMDEEVDDNEEGFSTDSAYSLGSDSGSEGSDFNDGEYDDE
ncbi:hypothetical protein DXG01_013597, partial [Tephrocybe rancida]